jgi:hypothetical protein
MPKLKFDYIKIGKYKRPIIPVRISFKSNSVNTPALIDSGADFNLFPMGIAESLGIKLNLDKPITFNGVGSEMPSMTGYMAVIDLMVFSKGEHISFSTPITFTNEIPSNGISLLGEFGFFDHLEEVCLCYKRGKVVIEN